MPRQTLSVEKVTTREPGFETNVETVTEGARYRVVVTSKGTEKAELAFLSMEVDSGAEFTTERAYVQISLPRK